MMVLITYDVSTETDAGKKRLRQVAKQCQNYGQRVQNSVFECIIDPGQLCQLQERILKIIDPEVDSVRYYYLGDE
jgi:CRISPR-associated protein Cas2